MRIAGGRLKGRRVPVVREQVRPTTERVREALMSMLGPQWTTQTILDAYAGSGAFGFEAISRGAQTVQFVEKNGRTADQIRQTAEVFGIESQVRIHRGDTLVVLKQLALHQEVFDVLFFDPPYESVDWSALLTLCLPLLAIDGLIVLEHSPTENVPETPEGLVLSDSRRYGSSAISVYEHVKRAEESR